MGESHKPTSEGYVLHGVSRYDLGTGLLFLGRERVFRDKCAKLAGLKPGDRVLDVGCGTGSLTLAAARRAGSGGEIYGIDASPEMIELARKKALREGLKIDFRQAMIQELPFPNEFFDAALSSLMLHHLPDDVKERGLREIRRVLKPGGVFLGVDFDLTNRPLLGPLFRLFHMGSPQSPVSKTHHLLEELGFHDLEMGPTPSRFLRFVRGRRAVLSA